MPDVRPEFKYTVILTDREFKLIGLALAGKIKPNSHEALDAKKLNLEMLKVRALYLRDMKNVADGALQRCQEELKRGDDSDEDQEEGTASGGEVSGRDSD